MLSLEGRVVVVSGGSRGIGRAVCVLAGQLGARVVVNYKADEAAANETVAAVTAHGASAVAVRADLARAEESDRLIAEAEAAFGRVDVVVANHGIWKRASLPDMTEAQWRETMAINLDGTWALSRAAARRMIPRRSGSIIAIASTAGQRGEPHYSHYAASKGAMLAFVKSLA